MRLLFSALLLVPVSLGAFDPANQDDSQALVRHFEPRSNPVGPPIQQGSFEPVNGETISLMGGADVFQLQDEGSFELALHQTFPKKQLKVRNLGWPADTVYRQQRPMYFYTEEGDTQKGSLPDLREKVTAGTFVLRFGKMESLDGLDALDQFSSAYAGLVEELSKLTERIILVQPASFESVGPAASLAVERNKTLEAYRGVIKDLASSRGLLWADSFKSLTAPIGAPNESLRSAILKKNHLWDQYYRPTNWAFLFGDRQHVPSSRDHRDANRRWFVEEIEKIPPLIAKAEREIWTLAGEVGNE